MPTRCPACGLPAADQTNGSCPSCATAWTAAGVTRLTLFTMSEGGSPTAAGTVALEDGRLGPYKVLKALGRGAMGTVVLAEPDGGGAPVAIKILIAPGLGTQLSRFLREGELLATMTHPNLVRVLEVRELSGHPCLVCEYLPGGTLRERLRAEGRLPWSKAARVMEQVLAGLEACHARGIVHRDLKPENVLFDASGNAKVADLGVAKHYGAEGPTLTGVGQLIGTPRYMSPEQVRGEAAVVASDLYAAGLLFWEMLAGHAPFDGGSVMEILRKHAVAPPPPVPPDVEAPPAVLAAIARALAKAPAERPPSAADFAQALSATRPSGKTARHGAGSQRSLKPARRRRWLRWMAAGAALVAIAAGARVATRPDERPLDPQIVLENGDARVTWRTRSACRGAVAFVPASGETRWEREDAPRTEHGVALAGLKEAGELAIMSGGQAAWRAPVARPPEGRARLVPTANGLTVRVPAAGATAGTLVRETGRGAEPEGPGALEGDELVFRTKARPFEIAPGSRVEVALAPGVTVRWPIESLGALAERLTRGLEAFDPTPAMNRFVLAPEYDPTLETQAVETFLGTRILGARRSKVAKDHFRRVIDGVISRQSWGTAFADFRPLADAWFASAQPPEAKRRLYAGLQKLSWLDLLILSQHEHDVVGFTSLFRKYLPHDYTSTAQPEPVERVVLPGELPLLERTSMFVPRGYVDWMQMRMFLQQEPGWCAATGVRPDAETHELRTSIPAQRTARLTLPPVPAGHRRRLRARVARMGPFYALAITAKPEGAPPLELRLQQPGTAKFMETMEEPFSGSVKPWVGTAYRYWAEISIDIPPDLLPAGACDFVMAYQSPPGVPLERLTRLVRGLGVREINLSVVR